MHLCACVRERKKGFSFDFSELPAMDRLLADTHDSFLKRVTVDKMHRKSSADFSVQVG